MRRIRETLAGVALLALCSCAVEGKGILLAVEPATPLDQRDLHKHCDLGDQAACALSDLKDVARPAPRFAVVQGVAVPDRAVFAAVVPKDTKIAWFIYDREVGRLWKLHDSRRQQRAGSSWYVQRVEARELEPGRTYELLAGDPEGNLIEDRLFTTLSSGGSALRFAAVSGLRSGSSAMNGGLVPLTREKKPQFVLFGGGNVDAFVPKKSPLAKRANALDFFFERHLAAREALPLARERVLTPVVAIWDESEFGVAGGDRSFTYRDQAREVFEMFFPLWADEATIMNGPGVSKSFSVAGQKLALLDDRSFRRGLPGPPLCSELKKKKGKKSAGDECIEEPLKASKVTRFGDMQANWAFRQAVRDGQPVWLISSESWLGILRAPESKAHIAPESWVAQLEAPNPPPPLSSPSGLALVDAQAEGSGLRVRVGSFGSMGQELSNRQLSLP